MKEFRLLPLPPEQDLENIAIYKQLVKSHKYLAELKATAKTIPNETILIDTLVLQEAKNSSEVENIITTHDELYKSQIDLEISNPYTKEVISYAGALKYGYEQVKQNGLLTNNLIKEIQSKLEQNNAGFRTQMGTSLKNNTGDIIYVPPQNKDDILDLMRNLEEFINNNAMSDFDPLIKMAIIHYQFESIHPFYDGNGRTGRIIIILYLILNNLIDIPILYLSRYIIRHKADYYRVLQSVRDNNDWESLILYLLEGIEEISQETITIIQSIKSQMAHYKKELRTKLPNLYSQELLNNLFKNPYTKIEFLQKDLNITRQTASKYLNQITDIGLLDKVKLGNYNYYINRGLWELFTK